MRTSWDGTTLTKRRRGRMPTAGSDVHGSREWAQTLVSATVGAPRYLNGNDGAYYWSELRDNDNEEAGPCGRPTYASPLKAAADATMMIGMVRLPEGWEVASE